VGREDDSPESEKGDRLYLFSSNDLVQWEYVHRFYESDRKWTEASEDNMCPSFLPLPSSPDGGPPSDKHLLLFISHNLGCQYYIGTYREDRFFPENHGRMTWVDNAYFAPEALIDGNGRQIMWSWIFDDRPNEVKSEYGWTGTYGLPRSLWLGNDGKLRMRPVKELRNLRLNAKTIGEFEVTPGKEVMLDSLGTALMELELTVALRNAQQVELEVCVSEESKERTSVIYDDLSKKLKINTQHSSLGYGRKTTESAPFNLRKGEPLVLRVFIDKSIVEVYANDRQAIARRIYPTLGGKGIRLSARGGDLKVLSLKRWEMAPSNPY
jgi:beta-fructofuranosidase